MNRVVYDKKVVRSEKEDREKKIKKMKIEMKKERKGDKNKAIEEGIKGKNATAQIIHSNDISSFH
jgi:hypothetical protein